MKQETISTMCNQLIAQHTTLLILDNLIVMLDILVVIIECQMFLNMLKDNFQPRRILGKTIEFSLPHIYYC